MHNGRRNNNRRFNKNNQKRRFGGGGGNNGFDDESNLSPQQRRNFANKRDQYLAKAKDALSAGDRVEAENYYQHADHCFRMMNSGLNGQRFNPQTGRIENPNAPVLEEAPVESNGDVVASNQAPSDIGSLPFMQVEAEAPRQPNIIE